MTSDQWMMVSFPLPPVRFCSAKLSYRMRRHPTLEGAQNDTITIGAAPFQSNFAPTQQVLWAATPGATNLDIAIDLTAELLANVQRAYAGKPVAYLDILAGDDTDFDFFKLVLVY
jgi:hypothetical protein